MEAYEFGEAFETQRRPAMFTYQLGGRQGKRYSLSLSDELIVVRTNDRRPVKAPRSFEVTPLSKKARNILDNFELVVRFEHAGVEVLRSTAPRKTKALRDRARSV